METNMEMTVANMTGHVQSLANAFHVVLVFDDTLKCDQAAAVWHMHPTLGRIPVVVAPPIKDDTGYAVVLHELGHHKSALGNLRNDTKARPPAPGCHPRERHRWMNLHLDEEDAAWEWARHYALWWTVGMEQVRITCYGTYEEAKRRTR